MTTTGQGFAGRRILLTGATGSIGRATALRLAEAGARIVLNGRGQAKLEKLAEMLPKGAGTIAALDLNDCDALPNWLREMCEKDGPFSGIAHIAGIYSMKPLRAVTADFIDSMLHANVTTGILLGKAFRQKVCHTEGASYVLVSSTASLMGGGGNVVYAASKGAVTAAAKGMAHELIRDKIRVNCVVPAMLESEMLDAVRKVVPPESLDVMLARQPMGAGMPDDVAQAIVYLLSDRTRWMTGSALQIDGGLGIGY